MVSSDNPTGDFAGYGTSGTSGTAKKATKTSSTSGAFSGYAAPVKSSGKGKKTSTPKVDTTWRDLQNGTVSAAQQFFGTLFAPLAAIESEQYSLLDPNTLVNVLTAKDTKKMDSIRKKAWDDAFAYQTGKEGGPTGGAIAKRLGLIQPVKKTMFRETKVDPNKGSLENFIGAIGQNFSDFGKGIANPTSDFWKETANIGVGALIDVVDDPFTYTPAGALSAGLKTVSKGTSGLVRGAIKGAKGEVTISRATKALGEDAAKELDITKNVVPGKVILKPNRATSQDGLSKAAQDQATYMRWLDKQSTETVKLPNAVDRGSSQKAMDAAATGLKFGLDAMRATIISHVANKEMAKYASEFGKASRATAKTARKKAGAEYVYDTSKTVEESLPQKIEAPVAPEATAAPKPSQAKVSKPKTVTAKRSEVPFTEREPVKFQESPGSIIGSKDVKALQTNLKHIDAIAKKVKGITPTSARLSETVSRFIQGVDAASHQIYKSLDSNLKQAINDAIKLNEYNPSLLFKDMHARAGKKEAQALKFVGSFGNRMAQFTTGRQPIGKFMLANANTPFHKLNMADKQIIMDALREFTTDSSKDLAAKLEQIVGDKKTVAELIDAGALSGRQGDVERIKKILEGINSKTTGGTEVRYGNADELIAGVRAGDIVPGDKLLQIIKLVDPAHSVVTQIEKAALKPSAEMFAEILKTGAIPTTISQMRQRLINANTASFVKSTGMGLAADVTAYLDGLLLGKIATTPSIHAASREAAARALSSMTNEELKLTADFLRETFGTRFDLSDKLLKQKGGHQRISDLMDSAILGAEKAYSGEDAILPNQTNASFQALLAAKIAGKNTWLEGKRLKRSATTGVYVGSVSENKMKSFVIDFAATREMLLAVTGSRFFIQKTRDIVGKDLANKHVVFVDLGDIVHEFMKTPKGKEVMSRAFFIAEDGFEKFDSLDGLSMLNVARQVLENSEKNIAQDLDALTSMAKYKHDPSKLTARYRKDIEKNAADFVSHLVESVAKPLEEIHLNRAKAATGDWVGQSLDINNQIINTLKDAWAAAIKTGWATPEKQFEVLQQLFHRFAYMAEAFKYTGGDVAEAVMRSASMIMVKGGKLAPEAGDALSEVYRLMPQKGSEDYANLMEILNTYSRHEDPLLAPPAGREAMKRPHPDFVNKVRVSMTQAKDAIDTHIKNGEKLKTPEALKAWREEGRRLARAMDTQRKNAWKAWLPTEHFSNRLGKWVPTEQYDHAAELEWAKQHPPILIGDKIVKIAEEMVDTVPEKPIPVTSKSAKATAAAEKSVAAGKYHADLATAAADDAAVKVANEADQFAAAGMNEAEQSMRLADELAYAQFDAMQYKTVYYNSLYKANPKEPIPGLETRGLGQRIVERMSLTGAKSDVAPFWQMAEASVHSFRGDIARVLQKMHLAYHKAVTDVDISTAISRALRAENVDEAASPVVQQLQQQMNQIISKLLKDAEFNNIPDALLKSAFEKYGLNEKSGFVLNGSLKDMLEKLPFVEKPTGIIDGSTEALKWDDRAKAFASREMSPMAAIMKVASAVQQVKTTQNLSGMLVSNVGYKAYGMSYKQAVEAGWVAIKSIDDKSGLIATMARPEDGALFHPNIARQIASMDREMTKALSGEISGVVTRTIMRTLGHIKFWQTSANLRHHIVNMVGDTTTELLIGTVNPAHWIIAMELAKEHAAQTLSTDYFKNAIEPAMKKVFAQMGDLAEASQYIMRYTKNGQKMLTISINGKATEVNFSKLSADMSRYAIMTNSIMQDEVMGLFETLAADATSNGAQRGIFRTIANKARVGIDQKMMKPIGDFTASYSNIPRAAGAVRIMLSRDWKNEEQMWAAVSEHVHLYHPSIQSLSTTERKYGRMAVSYYTWLRVAHSATLDMLLNHTATFTLPVKIQSNIRQQEGLNQTSPVQGYDPNANVPQNMRGSIYGPMFNFANGSVGIKSSTINLDVLDNYQFFFDPMVTGDTQDAYGVSAAPDINAAIGQNFVVGTKWLGGSSNQVLRQVFQEASGIDLQSQTPIYDRSPAAAIGRFANTLGPIQLLGALTGTTAVGKQLTPEEQVRNISKNTFGTKEFTTISPGLQKAATRENAARLKILNDRINKAIGNK